MSPLIEDIKKKYSNRFLALPGVISVGIGKDPDGQSIILIGLESPNPETEKKIPEALEGYPVRVEILGTIKAL